MGERGDGSGAKGGVTRRNTSDRESPLVAWDEATRDPFETARFMPSNGISQNAHYVDIYSYIPTLGFGGTLFSLNPHPSHPAEARA